jgi:polar amino acid transport system permease protein
MATTTASTSMTQKSQADLIHDAQVRKQRRFRMNVALSWILMLGFLLFLFSGISINLGPFHFRTIQLDTEFIRDNTPFIIGTIGFTSRWPYFIVTGVWATIAMSLVSIVFATLLAILTALGRLSTWPPLYALCTFYVSLIRGTPLYLQIFFFFLALPQLGIVLSGFAAGVTALSLNYGAYMSEIFRTALTSVGKGQREAAIALGMTPGQTLRRVVLPQAMRFAIPPVGNDFIAMTKDSALISVTGFVHELMWNAQKVGKSHFRNFEALLIAAIFYWIMTLVFSSMQSRLESQLSRGDR